MAIDNAPNDPLDQDTYRLLKDGLTETFRNALDAMKKAKQYSPQDATYTLAAADAGRALLELEKRKPFAIK